MTPDNFEFAFHPEPEKPLLEVRAIHDVPLGELLPREESSAFRRKAVSLYQYDGIQGPEHALVFPALSGQEWYEKFKAIAPYDPGFSDVVTDTRLILDSPNGRLGKIHQNAGPLWDMVMGSLPTKMDALSDDLRADYFSRSATYLRRGALESLKYLAGNSFLIPYDQEKVEQMAYFSDLLSGREVVDRRELMKIFGVHRSDVGAVMKATIPGMRDKSRRGLKPREVFSRYFHQLGFSDAANLVSRAAQVRFQSEDATYDHLAQLTVEKRYAALELTGKLTRFFVGEREYALPKKGVEVVASPEEDGTYRIQIPTGNSHITLDAWIRPDGDRITVAAETFEKQLKAKVDELNNKRNKIVPVVRFGSDPDNPFLVHEIDPMPTDVVDSIVSDIKGREPAARRSWISGVVGNEMTVLAHPGIRDIKDPWRSMWTDKRITISGLLGQGRKTFPLPDGTEMSERDQFNGPVQLSVTALEASRRYPDYFKPFARNVKAQFK